MGWRRNFECCDERYLQEIVDCNIREDMIEIKRRTGGEDRSRWMLWRGFGLDDK